jgi:hypothetical protein
MECWGKNSNIFEKAREDIMGKRQQQVRKDCGIENFLNKKYEPVTCFSTLSREVSIIFSFYIVMASNPIIIDTSMTCSWHVSQCCLFTGSTCVKGTIPFKMGRIATFKTLILLMSIILAIGG